MEDNYQINPSHLEKCYDGKVIGVNANYSSVVISADWDGLLPGEILDFDTKFRLCLLYTSDVHTGLPYPENIKVIDKRWMNDDGKGLYAILNQGKNLLGQTGERLA